MTRAVAFIDQDTSVAIAANTLCVIEGTGPTDAYTLVPTVVSVNPTTGVITGASLPAGGDVDGPASATLNAVAVYADITGKVIKNSAMIVDGSGNVTGVLALTATGLSTLAALTQVGTANINTSGAGVTTIGTGGTGAVNIGNTTGNTAVTGSLTASTTLTATSGAITATNGNFVFGTAGNKVIAPMATTTTAGANSFGTVTLVGGTATIATTAVTANSKIILSRQGIGATGAGALGILTIGTLTPGTSFGINSVQAADATALQASDVSVIYWEIKDSA